MVLLNEENSFLSKTDQDWFKFRESLRRFIIDGVLLKIVLKSGQCGLFSNLPVAKLIELFNSFIFVSKMTKSVEAFLRWW